MPTQPHRDHVGEHPISAEHGQGPVLSFAVLKGLQLIEKPPVDDDRSSDCTLGNLASQRSQTGVNASTPGAGRPSRPASTNWPKISAPEPRCDNTCAMDHSLSYEGAVSWSSVRVPTASANRRCELSAALSNSIEGRHGIRGLWHGCNPTGWLESVEREASCSRPCLIRECRWRTPAPAAGRSCWPARCCGWCQAGCTPGRRCAPPALRRRSS